MTEEKKTKSQPEATPAPTPAKNGGKSSFIKYIILGGIGLVAIAAAAVGTLMLFGGNQPGAPETTSVSDSSATHPGVDHAELTDEEILDSLLAGESDSGMLEMIEENLAALDYDPALDELGDGTDGMPAGDSAKEADWLAAEKKRLSEWETRLNDREKDLSRRESEMSRKMLVIEQTESAKTASLAKLYDGMDSRAVAKLMSNLDDATVVSILPRMKAKNASEVLQLLPPERAAKLSKQMITIAEM